MHCGWFFCWKVLVGSISGVGRGPNVTPNFHLGLGKVEDQRLEHAPCRISPFHSAPWPHFLRFEWISGSKTVPTWWQNAVITKIFTKIASGFSWLFAYFPDLSTRIENMRDCALGGGGFPHWPAPPASQPASQQRQQRHHHSPPPADKGGSVSVRVHC